MDKLNVSVSATLEESTHCICDMCHGTGKVISVLIPDTKYRPKGKKMLLVNEPILMWMCESCRDKLLKAICIPFQETKKEDKKMTTFNTQVGGGVYRIQFETDNQKAYKAVEEVIRAFVDMDNSNKVALNKMEKATHTEPSSACNCEALGTEVNPNG